jgi:DNA repair exonuclease SbcCD ATPase subunit
MNLQQIRNNLEQRKGQKIQIEKSIQILSNSLKEKKKDLRRHEQAREIIREVGLKTQQQLQFHISNITSLALEAVFDNPYQLEVEFVQRRNKTECDLYFVRNKNRVDPLNSAGIGAVDVAAFALRIASWSMQTPRSRNTLILDEPFKHLRGEKENERVFQMIKNISEKLGIQIIMIGDVKVSKDVMLQYADKLFETELRKGITQIKEI